MGGVGHILVPGGLAFGVAEVVGEKRLEHDHIGLLETLGAVEQLLADCVGIAAFAAGPLFFEIGLGKIEPLLALQEKVGVFR